MQFPNNRATDCAEKVREGLKKSGHKIPISDNNRIYEAVYELLSTEEFLDRKDPVPPILEPTILQYCREFQTLLPKTMQTRIAASATNHLRRVLEDEMVQLTLSELEDLARQSREAAKRKIYEKHYPKKGRGTRATNRAKPKRKRRR